MGQQKLLQSYPFLKEVDSFSLEAALELNKIRHSWFKNIYVVEWQEHKYWEIKLASSINPETLNILISSYGGEITVYYFDWFHAHFQVGINAPTLAELIQSVVDFVNTYVQEDYLVAYNCGEDGKVLDGTTFHSSKLNQIDLSRYQYLASWLGTYDKKLHE